MGALSWRSVFQKFVTKRISASLIVTTMVIFVLAGCSSKSSNGPETPSADPTSTLVPTSTPVPTPEPQLTETSTPTDSVEESEAQPATTEDDGVELTPEVEPTLEPTAEQGIEWVTYENAEHGYSLKHPVGWSVGPPMNGRLLIANEELDCASCRIIPPGTVLMTITPGADPPQRSGEPVRLGGFYYGEIFYGGVSGAMDPDRVFEIHYHTAEIEWRIYASFGDPINADNPLRDQVFELIHSIEHDSTPPSTAPQPTSRYELVARWEGFDRPTGIAVDSIGNVYVAETGNSRVVKVTSSGEPIYQITHNSNGAPLNIPMGVSVGDSRGEGYLYISDSGNDSISFHHTSGSPGFGWTLGSDPFQFPRGIVWDRIRGPVYVAVEDRVAKFTPSGEAVWEADIGGDLGGIALDPAGTILVADRAGNRIVRLSSSGSVFDEWHGFSQPTGVAADNHGNVYVSNSESNRVVRVSEDGTIMEDVGASEQFDSPRGVAVDDRGRIYVTDNTHVQIFAPPWAE